MHPKDAKQWQEGRIAKPKNANTCLTNARRAFFNVFAFLVFAIGPSGHCFASSGVVVLHFGRFAVGPTGLGQFICEKLSNIFIEVLYACFADRVRYS
jgi:hypothetical protein